VRVAVIARQLGDGESAPAAEGLGGCASTSTAPFSLALLALFVTRRRLSSVRLGACR
jgi:hypothetical protein